ncbi:formate dehydrogenase accessory sulfurtransferase FdhD [Microaerobacter geothermalis]|uniref:formate dehydrogenase accessory sulfurtransferase FdhD n=1 Tax=Microaerobacter geothermalis TaxID=674972 RepID=UPI001F2F789A|nr:formate dehydrogenase accessory sulfurtransferase FdhD [Microaerobacter geothermalis]MCF6093008.1 formate dehydrogenase accessory sulfurtransferase FdhD [Microaerobacter geothermalis]
MKHFSLEKHEKKQMTKIHLSGKKESCEDFVVKEYPLTIYIHEQEIATLVCSPNHMDELIIGFLAGEGMISDREDIQDLSINDKQGQAYLTLAQLKGFSREMINKRILSSCCGKSRASFYFFNDSRTAKRVSSSITLEYKQCFYLMEQLQSQSLEFLQTGGVHNAALASPKELILSRYDIGRHNALDKLFGYALKEQLDLKDKIIVFSGRISSEILLKVSKMGIGILLSKSAPTSLALDMAHDLGITTVGFIRRGQMNVYTHPHRIIGL